MSDSLSSFSARAHGLPTREELVPLRIWDQHYHGISPPYVQTPAEMNEYYFKFVDRMGIELVCPFLYVGLHVAPEDIPTSDLERQLEAVFKRWPDRLAAHVWLNPRNVAASLKAIERWVANGPMVGLKFSGEGFSSLPCSHPNFHPLVERAIELDAPIYIHAWYQVGGNPRRYDGGGVPSASKPSDVALLAERYPNAMITCGHSGGDWELGIRTIRKYPNVFLEFAGSDPHSGSVDFAVRELGAERVTWGGHIPSRSFATELSKVFDADLTEEQRKMIFGRNLRRRLAPILRKKGRTVEI